MNPAIDLFIKTPELLPDIVNRAKDDEIQANGKGVNVSLVLKKLGVESTAIGFSAGFTGSYIKQFLRGEAITASFVEVDGFTRINVFTQVTGKKLEYKLVNKGPQVTGRQLESLLEKISRLSKGDYLCVSGSLPPGVGSDVLVRISRIADEKQFNLILDSSSARIMDCLSYRPFLLKPNEQELTQWFGEEKILPEHYPQYLQRLLDSGAQRVLLSLGAQGAFYADGKRLLSGNAPQGRVVNTACSGDTMLAVFLNGSILGHNTERILRHSIASGSSTAFSTGLSNFQDVAQLMENIKIKEFLYLKKYLERKETS